MSFNTITEYVLDPSLALNAFEQHVLPVLGLPVVLNFIICVPATYAISSLTSENWCNLIDDAIPDWSNLWMWDAWLVPGYFAPTLAVIRLRKELRIIWSPKVRRQFHHLNQWHTTDRNARFIIKWPVVLTFFAVVAFDFALRYILPDEWIFGVEDALGTWADVYRVALIFTYRLIIPSLAVDSVRNEMRAAGLEEDTRLWHFPFLFFLQAHIMIFLENQAVDSGNVEDAVLMTGLVWLWLFLFHLGQLLLTSFPSDEYEPQPLNNEKRLEDYSSRINSSDSGSYKRLSWSVILQHAAHGLTRQKFLIFLTVGLVGQVLHACIYRYLDDDTQSILLFLIRTAIATSFYNLPILAEKNTMDFIRDAGYTEVSSFTRFGLQHIIPLLVLYQVYFDEYLNSSADAEREVLAALLLSATGICLNISLVWFNWVSSGGDIQ